MQKLILSFMLLGSAVVNAQEKPFKDSSLLQPVEVNAVRAAEKAPFAKTILNKTAIQKLNLGQDLPFLLDQTPSVIVNSDAGTGIGYTGIRIRGSDITRINVTLNGIPYNDAESQATFFVDLPDFSSSVNSIQVQRGIGTSTNGAGSFGASINLSTNEVNKDFYAEIGNTYGSFNTWKHSFQFGSGLLGKHVTIDGRLSNISSNGYIDRAKADLYSAYTSVAWVDAKHSLRFNFLTGKERTYQAWNGVPEYLLETDRTYNSAGTEQPGKPYENEVDNYQQTHYQVFYNQQFNSNWKFNLAGFLTHGKGYYEQYKAGADFADYGLADYNDGSTTYTSTDLVRRLWLNNDFYGGIFSFQYKKATSQLIIGGGYDQYDGLHFGEVIWAKVPHSIPANYHWYDLNATKKDFSLYSKWTEQWGNTWQSFIDLQVRSVQYTIDGFRNNPGLFTNNSYSFFNPKLGVTYTNKSWQAYASLAYAGHEPNRDDFEAAVTDQPKAEQLTDVEAGVSQKNSRYNFDVNFFYMKYRDQLVLTGKINDVGAYTRTNIPNSYRAGVEVQGMIKFADWINISANLTLSKNVVRNFSEYIDDYDNGGQVLNSYNKPDIALSPAIIAGGTLQFKPVKNAELSFISKYVGKQFLDNTSNNTRSLKAYFVQDVSASYNVFQHFFKETNIIARVNNIFSRAYEPSGYTFSYIYGGKLNTENFYFPMAKINFMVGVNVKL